MTLNSRAEGDVRLWSSGDTVLVVLIEDRLFYREYAEKEKHKQWVEAILGGENPAEVLDEITSVIPLDRIISIEQNEVIEQVTVRYQRGDGTEVWGTTISPSNDDSDEDRTKLVVQLFAALRRVLGPNVEQTHPRIPLGDAILHPTAYVIGSLILTVVLYWFASMVDPNAPPDGWPGRLGSLQRLFVSLVEAVGVLGVTGIGVLCLAGSVYLLVQRIIHRPTAIRLTRRDSEN